MLADTYEPTIFFPGGATRRAEPMSDVLTDHDLIGLLQLDPEKAGDWINRYKLTKLLKCLARLDIHNPANASRCLWYVQIPGKQHNLGADEAIKPYHELMTRHLLHV